MVYRSHPAWVCGLKLIFYISIYNPYAVTPCVGVWIETYCFRICQPPKYVTPCVGVWIETLHFIQLAQFLRVTPCVGVWIETNK